MMLSDLISSYSCSLLLSLVFYALAIGTISSYIHIPSVPYFLPLHMFSTQNALSFLHTSSPFHLVNPIQLQEHLLQEASSGIPVRVKEPFSAFPDNSVLVSKPL